MQILKPLYLIIAVVVLSHAAYAGTLTLVLCTLVSGAVSTLFGVSPMFWAVSAIHLGTVFATRAQRRRKTAR